MISLEPSKVLFVNMSEKNKTLPSHAASVTGRHRAVTMCGSRERRVTGGGGVWIAV